MVFVNQQPNEWYPEMTVAKLLETMEGGHLYAVVRLNGKLVSRPHFDATRVPENAVIEPIPMVAGG